MSFEKAEIKRLTVQDVGQKIAKRQEAAKHEVVRMEGGVAALREASSNFDRVKAHWKAKLDADEPEVTQDTVRDIIKAIDMCAHSVSNLADKLQATKVAKNGEVFGYDQALNITEAIFKEEGNKAVALSGEPHPAESDTSINQGKGRPKMRVVGEKPPPSAASQRKAAPPEKKTKRKVNKEKPAVVFSGVVPKSANRAK